MGMIKHIRVKNDIGSVFDSDITIEVCHEFDNRIAIRFLTLTTFCFIGYYKWYFRTEFLNVFEYL